MNFFEIYKIGKEITFIFDNICNELMHDGKRYLGEVIVQDSSGCLCEIKVRWTGDRGRYLKI